MAAGCCGRVFGWGLPALILGTLLGAFSTTLIGLQTLNGLFCFDTVRSEVTLADVAVSSFAVSGYVHNHYLKGNFYCKQTNKFLKREKYPFCRKWSTTDRWNLTSRGIRCRQRVKGKGAVKGYSYTLVVNCTSSLYNSATFMLSLTPGSSSLTGVGAAGQTGYFTEAVVSVNRCALSRYFYIVFSSACAAITMTIFVIRAGMRTCLVGLSFRLSQSRTLSWVYEALEKQGFYNFENPYRNEPYHLVEGERFYVMRDPKSCTSGDVVGDTSDGDTDGGMKPLRGKTTESGDRCVDTDGGDTDSLVWSSAHSVYKFTYVDGQVFAYCKDRCGFETFVKANIKSSVASVIKQYLIQKSRSACVTNDAKSHFLSLTECCELAQKGYELVEKTSTGNYRMFYWSPRTLSHRSAETV